jgi:cell filamentation protein, protein adenylyltransferase
MPRPSRDTIYNRLETSVEGLASVGGLPLPAEARAIWKDIWHEEAHHSTAMEGNTLLLREVQLLLETGKAVGSKEMKAYLEVQSYGKAAEWVYAQARERGAVHVTASEIRQIHEIAVETVWAYFPPDQLDPREGPGAYRRKEIEPFTGGMKPPTWPDVPAAVSDWVERVNESAWVGSSERHAIEDFADLHAAFERIHPFRDGNGRVGRLLLNLLLVRHGYPPAVIYKRDRDRYLNALQRADSGDCGALGELLARSIKQSVDRFILPGLAGPHKLIPISALAGTGGLSRNALTLAAQRGRLEAVKKGNVWHSTKVAVEEYGRSRYKHAVQSDELPEHESGTPAMFTRAAKPVSS